MQVHVSQQNGVFIIALLGRLDAMTASDCEKALDEVLGGGVTLLLLDLEAVEYVSSAGLRVILKAAKALYDTGRLALARPQEGVREVLEMTGFGEIMPIHDSVEEALAELQNPH
ncbi:anti-sigma factor antagonist [Thermodesulfomicrobium sp. WS]|uniref:STAS domain-containing protein n=1 Tax=Thermodesulfomicrobium sp. WS TaxID=3004129 RepID=UPI00248F91B6|nr:STAS domain-containing protein [Thermodesulfomicrobium sp. WS]BDV01945.1 anti-sigma factor antagonist [Thermodesulfomicrobium sp. WS]